MTDAETSTETKRIAELNDSLRAIVQMPVFGPAPGKVYVTRGITALPPVDQIEIMACVRSFDDFTENNDPYGERDFGAFDHNGQKIFWKIDYYDRALKYGSEDPSDPEKTTRVLTIMLAEEY